MKDTLLEARFIQNLAEGQEVTALHLAAIQGHLDCVNALLDIGGKDLLYAVNDHKQTALPYALYCKDPVKRKACVDALLERGGATLALMESRFGSTAFYVAVHQGHLECLDSFLKLERPRKLLCKGNSNRISPIECAVVQGHGEVLAFLLNNEKTNQCLHWQHLDGRTALHAAVLEGRSDFVAMLLKAGGAELARICKKGSKETALHMAARCGEAQCIEHFLALDEWRELLDMQNYDVDGAWCGNATPFQVAALCGHTTCLRAFVDKIRESEKNPLDKIKKVAQEIGKQNDDGHTSLHFAAYGGFSGCVKLLLECGTPDLLLKPDMRMRTALDHVRGGDACRPCRQLLQNAQDVPWVMNVLKTLALEFRDEREAEHKLRLQNLFGVAICESPISLADSDGDAQEAVKVLQAIKAKFPAGMYSKIIDKLIVQIGENRQIACFFGRALVKNSEKLLSEETRSVLSMIDVNLRDDEGYVALHRAARDGDIERLADLLNYPFTDPRILTTRKNKTVLHLAVGKGQVQCLELLLTHLAAMNPLIGELESNGSNIAHTAVWRAVRHKEVGCLELLLKYPSARSLFSVAAARYYTPFRMAVDASDPKLFELLLTHPDASKYLGIEDFEKKTLMPLTVDVSESCREVLTNYAQAMEFEQVMLKTVDHRWFYDKKRWVDLLRETLAESPAERASKPYCKDPAMLDAITKLWDQKLDGAAKFTKKLAAFIGTEGVYARSFESKIAHYLAHERKPDPVASLSESDSKKPPRVRSLVAAGAAAKQVSAPKDEKHQTRRQRKAAKQAEEAAHLLGLASTGDGEIVEEVNADQSSAEFEPLLTEVPPSKDVSENMLIDEEADASSSEDGLQDFTKALRLLAVGASSTPAPHLQERACDSDKSETYAHKRAEDDGQANLGLKTVPLAQWADMAEDNEQLAHQSLLDRGICLVDAPAEPSDVKESMLADAESSPSLSAEIDGTGVVEGSGLEASAQWADMAEDDDASLDFFNTELPKDLLEIARQIKSNETRLCEQN